MLDLQKMKQRLLEEKSELEDSIKSMEGRGLGDRFTDSVGELSAYDQHSGDAGAEMFERSKDLGLLDNERIILGKINESLELIDNGTYGTCEKCGDKINEERLEAIPYTTVCIECKSEDEMTVDRMRRPVEEEVLQPPFGRSFKDDEDYTGFDGEDAWQSVARWGTANSPQDVPDSVSTDEAYIDSDEPVGVVEDVEAVIDAEDEGIGDPEDIYPEPSLGKRRRPHPIDMRTPRRRREE